MTPKLKKIIATLLILGILFVVYAIFIKQDPTQAPLVNTGGNSQLSGDAQQLGNQISQALLRIEQIKLDRAIFNSDIYKSLHDRSQPIIEEPIGRTNPFAPIGAVSLNSNIRNTSSTTTATSTKVQKTVTATSTSTGAN